MKVNEVSFSEVSPFIPQAHLSLGAKTSSERQGHWFYYWKTAASLWDAKLAQFSKDAPVLIPVYWAHHVHRLELSSAERAQYVQQGEEAPLYRSVYDFGEKRQDTNLLELEKIAQKYQLELIFLLPLGPFPFLPAGGMPSWSAKNFAYDQNGSLKIAVDQEGRIHKMYSFYDAHVFHDYRKFMSQLGHHLKGHGAMMRIYATQAWFQVLDSKSEFKNTFKEVSFFEDYSPVAKKGFQRFKDKNPVGFESSWHDFHQQMLSLYRQVIQECFSGHYRGEVSFVYIGAHPWRPLECIQNHPHQNALLVDQMKVALQKHYYPSLALIENQAQGKELHRFYDAVFCKQWHASFFTDSLYSGELNGMMPLELVSIYYPKEFNQAYNSQSALINSGLAPSLEKDLNNLWAFAAKSLDKNILSLDPEDIDPNKILIILELIQVQQSAVKAESSLKNILKLFLAGQRIVLNISGLSSEQLSQLQSFIYENQLVRSESHVLAPLSYIHLGEGGGLYLVELDAMKSLTAEQKLSFWSNLWSVLKLPIYAFKLPPGLKFFAHKRLSATMEFQYQEVRRFMFYNTRSEPMVFSIPRQFDHVFMKIFQSHDVEFKSNSQSFDLIFAPQGMIALDFGLLDHQDDG